MARPLRIEYPNAWYHVMNRGRRGEHIFEAKDDYERFINILNEAIELFSLRVSAYCLMSNHYHILVQTPDANLSRCMRHINGVYTQRYNSKHSLDGQLFRGRYKAINVSEDNYLLQLIRYIHRNPVRAGIVEKAEDYLWSSHKGYLSGNKKWDWLYKEFILSILSKVPGERIKKYRKFMKEEEDESFLRMFNMKKLPSILGDSQFVEKIKTGFFQDKLNIEVPESKLLAPDIETIKKHICSYYDIQEPDLYNSKRAVYNEPRSMGMYLSRQIRGESLKNIGEQFHVNNYSTVSSEIERFKMRKQSDRSLAKRIKQVKTSIMSQGQT